MKFERVFKRLLMILIAAAMILPETGAVVWADDISSLQGSYVEAFPEAIDDIGEAGPVADEAVPEISGTGETDDVLTGDADSEDISFEGEGISNDSASPTVYCNTKAEAYEAVRNIIRNRVNKMDYYNAKITNPDKVYNNFVYDRIYVREDLFGAMYISMTDVCDFEEERMGMKPYEGDYMYNLIGDSINPRFFYEDPQSPDDPDVQTWIESGGVFYKLYEVYLPVITTKEQEDELDKKVEEILSTPAFRNVKDGTNDQKIKVIFDYVKGTVKSASGDRTRPIVHTAYSALCTSGHQGTCEAYAQAFYRLAREMGVPARVLMGLDANNHTYNLVKRDDGYWWFIDCSSGTYLKSYKEFKHAQLQDRFKTPKFQYNYWNNVKDYTDRVDPTRVFRNGDEILTSIDLQELYEYTRNDMAAHPGAEYLIRLGSDQTVDETNGEVFYFYGDERKKVSLDLNGHTLNLRSSGDIYLKEIKNGSITIGKAEVFRGHVYGQSGQWRLNADLINDLSITGLLNGFDRCFICGNNDTKISNVSVNKLHFWARNKLILNGDLIINNCSAADIGDHDIVKGADGLCRGKVIFKGNNTLGRVGDGYDEEDYAVDRTYSPKPMIVRAVDENGTVVKFKPNDVIATNEGKLKYYSNGSAAAATFDKIYDFAKINEAENAGLPDDETMTLKVLGKDLIFAYPAEVQVVFKYNAAQVTLLDDKGLNLNLIAGKTGARQGKVLKFKVVPKTGYMCTRVFDGSVLAPDTDGLYSVNCDRAKSIAITSCGLPGVAVSTLVDGKAPSASSAVVAYGGLKGGKTVNCAVRLKFKPAAGRVMTEVKYDYEGMPTGSAVLAPTVMNVYDIPVDAVNAATAAGKDLSVSASTVKPVMYIKKGGSEEYEAVVNKGVVKLKSDDTAELGVFMDSAEGEQFVISDLALKPANVDSGFATLSNDKKKIIIDASKASTLGKNVSFVLKGDFGTQVVTLNVAQKIVKLSVKGFKSVKNSNEAVAVQAAGTTVKYAIALNRNADTSRLELVCDPAGCAEITQDAKGNPILKVDTFVTGTGGTVLTTDAVRVRFVDRKDTSIQYGNDHMINILEPGKVRMPVPAVKPENPTDIDMVLKFTLPKAAWSYGNLYYRVEAEAVGGTVPNDMKESVTEFVPVDTTSYRLVFMKDPSAVPGTGHAQKYDLKVSIVQIKDSSLPVGYGPGERYGEDNLYISGAARVLKNQGTKAP